MNHYYPIASQAPTLRALTDQEALASSKHQRTLAHLKNLARSI